MKSYIIRSAAALLLLCLFLSGCKEKDGLTAETEDSDIVIVDALGYEHRVTEAPKRVAALIGSFAKIWTLAGGSLVAASADAWTDFDLTLPDAVNVGGAHSPSAELLLSARPDLVIASASTAKNVELRDLLTASGIRVVYYDVDNFEDYLKMLRELTLITGREDLYEKNGESLRRQIEQTRTAFLESGIPEEQKRILLIRASVSSIKAKGSTGTILGEMLYDMGCINIADTDGAILENLSVESIVAANPYRIFVVTMGDDTEAAKEAAYGLFTENPALSKLDAVKEGRLHVMDKRLYNMKPCDRWADAYGELYEILTQDK